MRSATRRVLLLLAADSGGRGGGQRGDKGRAPGHARGSSPPAPGAARDADGLARARAQGADGVVWGDRTKRPVRWRSATAGVREVGSALAVPCRAPPGNAARRIATAGGVAPAPGSPPCLAAGPSGVGLALRRISTSDGNATGASKSSLATSSRGHGQSCPPACAV